MGKRPLVTSQRAPQSLWDRGHAPGGCWRLLAPPSASSGTRVHTGLEATFKCKCPAANTGLNMLLITAADLEKLMKKKTDFFFHIIF